LKKKRKILEILGKIGGKPGKFEKCGEKGGDLLGLGGIWPDLGAHLPFNTAFALLDI